jgi:hypothetical protein
MLDEPCVVPVMERLRRSGSLLLLQPVSPCSPVLTYALRYRPSLRRCQCAEDNQSGEGNSFTNNVQAVIDNFDLEREFGYSVRDSPHRLNISGTLELPFGAGRRWLSNGGL